MADVPAHHAAHAAALAVAVADPVRDWIATRIRPVLILTKGGPDNSTITVVQLIYREAFQRQNLGTAAALSIIVLIVLLLINVLQPRFLLRRKD